MTLQEELARLEAEVEAARVEQAVVSARISGLLAQRDAIAATISRSLQEPTHSGASDSQRQTKDRAIVEVLRRSSDPLRIGEIVRALHAEGRPNENYSGVSVYLDALLKQDRVRRVSRGLYTATS